MERDEERFGEYILVEPLGQGGMGRVYKAYHQADRDRVYPYAIKRITTNEPEVVGNLMREVAIGRTLRGPFFVETYDGGVIDNQPWLLMEYVDGIDIMRLISRLKRRGRKMPIEVIVEVLEKVAQGLSAAHHHVPRGRSDVQPVIHRDLKPSNVLLRRDGQVKIADFGVAKRVDVDADDSHERVGTVAYMSPEQISGAVDRPIGPASDVFSFGSIAFEVCAQTPLFHGSETYILQQLQDPDPLIPPRLREIGGDVHPELLRIMSKCLRFDPRMRYADGGELAEDLGALRTRLGFSEGVLAQYMAGFTDLGSGESEVGALTAGRAGGTAVALPLFRDRGPLTGRNKEVLEFSARRRLPAREREALREKARIRKRNTIIAWVVLVLAMMIGGSYALKAAVPTVLRFESDPGALLSISETCTSGWKTLQPTPLTVHWGGKIPFCIRLTRRGYLTKEVEVTKKLIQKGTVITALTREVCVEVATDPPSLPVKVDHRWQTERTGNQVKPLRLCGLDPGVPYLVQVRYRGEAWDVARFVGKAGDSVSVYRSFIPPVEEVKDPHLECRQRYEWNRLDEALGYCMVAVAESVDYVQKLEAHLTQARIFRAFKDPENMCRAFFYAMDEAVKARDRRRESDLLIETRASGCEVP